MKQLTVVKTFFSRFFILFLSFGLVIFTTNVWGSEGKGAIAMVIANVAIVTFFSGIFTGSSSSYFASRFKVAQILPLSYIWAICIGLVIPFVLSFAQIQSEFLIYLIGISVFSALLNTNISFFIGTRNIKLYNTYTILQLSVHVVLLMIFFFGLHRQDVSVYFISQVLALIILFVVSFFQIIKQEKIRRFSFSKEVFKNMFEYGWKTQLSAFIQFLNYRLSFYFLEYYQGLAVVGIFSVGITFAEAIWTVTRSMAVVLYSEVMNSKSSAESIVKTKNAVKITFWLTIVFLLCVLVIPENVYSWIFGKDFVSTRIIVLYLALGILAIATSDMVGHYFSGTKQLRILNLKSLLGLVFTIIFSVILIPKYGVLGACVATSISYFASSGLLFFKFFKETEFHFKDYLITRNELKSFFKTLFKC